MRAIPVSDQPRTKRLTVDLPPATHRRFKSLCAARDLRMNDEIRSFIERRIAELEERPEGTAI